MNEVSLRVQRLGRLRDVVLILLVRRHVADLIGHDRILRIRLVDLPEGRLHKAVLIDPRVAGEGVDESDVGTFRRLDRAHSSVVRVMNIADLESRAVT